MIEIFILSLIQGITEFLPISSSSHLILIADKFEFENQKLSIDVSLHIGSFIAVLFYFRKDIVSFFDNRVLFFKVLISSFPVMVVGYFLIETNIIQKLRNIEVIAWTTTMFAILLYISDKFKLEKSIKDNLNYKSILFIGLFQILSLIPGVSRSGIAITAARFGFKNILLSDDIFFSRLNLLSIFISFFFSLVTIKFFLKYITKFSLNIFVCYRILLGAILLVLTYL